MKTWSIIKTCKECGREYIGPKCDNKLFTPDRKLIGVCGLESNSKGGAQ